VSEYFTAPSDVTASRARSSKINEIIQATEDGFDALPSGLGDLSTEVEAARDGYSTLLEKEQAQDTAISAATSGSGVLVSAADTTIGYLNGKLVAGRGVSFSVSNPGGNESMAINVGDWKRKTTDFTAEISKSYKVGAGVTVTLPTSPSDNDQIWFSPLEDIETTNSTIARAGTEKIMGLSENMTWDANVPFSLVYDSTNTDWRFA
jgi:hypothetical protein